MRQFRFSSASFAFFASFAEKNRLIRQQRGSIRAVPCASFDFPLRLLRPLRKNSFASFAEEHSAEPALSNPRRVAVKDGRAILPPFSCKVPMMNQTIPFQMPRIRRVAMVAGFLVVVALPLRSEAAQAFSSLEEQMTGVEFTAAGLQKLTPDELEALNQWIRKRSLATLDVPSRSGTSTGGDQQAGLSSIEDMEREEFTSRIVGPFSGWDGQTVFKLENGMIWAQAKDDKFYTREIQSPAVTIKPGMFGNWYLEVEGVDEECRVERIQ